MTSAPPRPHPPRPRPYRSAERLPDQGFAVGEEVFGIGQGSFAEYARARQDKLARKPASLTFGQAAVVAVSGLTALQGPHDAGCLQPGQHVLITGASGGVGTFAVQIAKALGAQVTGVRSTAKTDPVTSIGASHVLDYTRDDFADGFDAALGDGGRERTVSLRPGEIFVVPKGTEHKPSSPGGFILMFEPSGTLTTGDRHQDDIPAHIDSTAGLDISG